MSDRRLGVPARISFDYAPPARTAVLIKWWLLRVSGPPPGRPAQRGEFAMEVSAHGNL